MALNLLLIEPYFGGSHKEFAENLARYSKHTITIESLPACNWNWRLNGSAFLFSRSIKNSDSYDGIIATNMMHLSDFKAICPVNLPPVIVYFHENQLTYPLAPGQKRDKALCYCDISTALAADRVVFNSGFHRKEFIEAVSEFLNRTPDTDVNWVKEEIESKSSYLYPGCNFGADDNYLSAESNDPPLILWNHRWSYDKNAPSFFYALDSMIKKGIDFKLAIAGEHPGLIPEVFYKAEKRYKDRLVQFGYVENKHDYYKLLKKSSIVISTSHQENFGISMVEAIRYGCFPLLPARLSYPEIIPGEYHDVCLYENQKEFLEKLETLLTAYPRYSGVCSHLSRYTDRYSWENMIHLYDKEFEALFGNRRN